MKRKLISLCLTAALLLACVNFTGFFAGGKQVPTTAGDGAVTLADDGKLDVSERDVETGYLMRDNFVSYNSAKSAWERVNIPTITGSTAIITKQAASIEAYMRREYVPQDGAFTVEHRIIPVVEVKNGSIRLEGLTASGIRVDSVRVNIKDNVLYYQLPDREVEIGTLKFGAWTGLKYIVDVGADSVDVYVNGILTPAATGLPLSYPATAKINTVFFGMEKGSGSTGTFKVGTVYVYKGYDLYEDLLSAGTGNSFDGSEDYNKTATPVPSFKNAANNANTAYLAFDGNDDTYWEHNLDLFPEPDESVFKAEYGRVIPIDTVVIKMAAPYKGFFNFTYFDAGSSWTGFENPYWFMAVDLAAGEECKIELSEPVFAQVVALNFRETTDNRFVIPQGIKLATFEAYCKTDLVGAVPNFPGDWQRTAPDENGSVAAYEYYGYNEQAEYNVFKLENKGAPQELSHAISTASSSVHMRFKLSYNNLADGNAVILEHSSGNALSFMTADGKLKFGSVSGAGAEKTVEEVISTAQQFTGFMKDMWYMVDIKYDAATGKAGIAVNGWSQIADFALEEEFKTGNWTAFKAVTSDSATIMYLDEIKVMPLPEVSNVPELDPCNTGDTILTMQACTLWREGTHLGWAAIDREEMYVRKPILGWYDEGTPEVADWEIKFAVDHGINNFMYCWYRNNTGPGPIYNSGLSDELWDGIFQSKYRDDISFSLMYTNNDPLPSSYSYSDLMDNLMPYWIETFFKNPNYLRNADGLPIFFLYEHASFLRQVGDCNGDGKTDVKDVEHALEEMRQKCVDAGLPGLYVITEYRGDQSTAIMEREAGGYDAVFAYTWSSGTYNMTNDAVLEYTKSSMTKQRNAVEGDMKIIPNISKQWDPRGWTDIGFGGPSPIYNYDLEHYRQLAVWVKETFGGAVIDSKGTKLIMLDNWNEFSEGHWLMPTYGTPAYKGGAIGYGYLDILREVFGINQYEHTDHMPLEEGFGPYDSWYSPGWENVNDQYTEKYGVPVDDSVKSSVADYNVGVNSTGGGSAYDISGTADGGLVKYEYTDKARVTLSAAEVDALKADGRGAEIAMLNGTVTVSAGEIDKLEDGKGMEVVLNQLINAADAAAKVRQAGGTVYGIYRSKAFDFSIKQDGRAVSLDASVTLERPAAVGDAAIITDAAVRANLTLAAGDTVMTVAVSGNVQIALIKIY